MKLSSNFTETARGLKALGVATARVVLRDGSLWDYKQGNMAWAVGQFRDTPQPATAASFNGQNSSDPADLAVQMDIKGTVERRAIEKPEVAFLVKILRKPVLNVLLKKAAQWELWKVRAETDIGALKVAQYHFPQAEHIDYLGRLRDTSQPAIAAGFNGLGHEQLRERLQQLGIISALLVDPKGRILDIPSVEPEEVTSDPLGEARVEAVFVRSVTAGVVNALNGIIATAREERMAGSERIPRFADDIQAGTVIGDSDELRLRTPKRELAISLQVHNEVVVLSTKTPDGEVDCYLTRDEDWYEEMIGWFEKQVEPLAHDKQEPNIPSPSPGID